MLTVPSAKFYQSIEQKSPQHSNIFNKNITVRFKLSDFDTIAQVYPSTSTVGSVLDDIASKFKLLPKYLTLKRDKKLSKNTELSQICTNSFDIVDVQLNLSDLARHINESIQNDYEKIHLDTDLYYR